MKATIAIIGKPNVGKSTLFNRLVGKRIALVSDIPGTTRDRIYQAVELGTRDALLIDTGGMQYKPKETIEHDVRTQALIAMQEANLIAFVIDASHTPTIEDEMVIRELRKSKKPWICIANKIDRKAHESSLHEYFRLGIPSFIQTSGTSGIGMEELRSTLEREIKRLGFKRDAKRKETTDIIISLIGRPNVGKSSLLNRMIGKPKMIVSDIPGTTRDTVDTELTWNEKRFVIKDTAGVRRRGKIGKRIEFWSVIRGMIALDDADIGVVILDGSEGVVNQDCHIAGYVAEQKKGLIVVINKIDLLTEEEQHEIVHKLQHRMAFLPWAPVILTSAKTGKHVEKIFELAEMIHEERHKKVSKEQLKELLQEAISRNMPGRSKGAVIKIIDIEQTNSDPPTFRIIVTNPDGIHGTYRRYLERVIRDAYGFSGTAINMQLVSPDDIRARPSHRQRLVSRKKRR